MKVCIVGASGKLGRYMVQECLDRGHEVTLFNRGRTNTHLFPQVEKLVGDRNGQLDALQGGTWDVVIDNSTARPDSPTRPHARQPRATRPTRSRRTPNAE